ncbi:SepM family pheromone-processing serine protease [Bacillus sp. 1P06AnD]|uniref:SepM family pheromone-processing serine protease n=1 Tax=Bacillus sp. 1P06AnD TaxID=3132208 RepID=UPI0039A20F89
MKQGRIFKALALAICIAVVASYFIPLPYYVTKPGMAKELAPIIKVEDGYKESGDFKLTTISMGEANIFTYGLAKVMKYWDIYRDDEIRGEKESDKEYNMRQLHEMEGSKVKAIVSAYKHAGKPYETIYRGVYVYGVVPGMPAEDVLAVGDRITDVDHHQLKSSKQFIDYVASKKAGTTITLGLIREDKRYSQKIKLDVLPKTGKVGMGITLVDDMDVKTDPKVKIDTDKIGGPSAGLMFTLEIYNQLVPEDITKGKDIAGTGTMDEEGNVGPIGGIHQKVVAADKSGAAVFFAPNEKGAKGSNYKVAKKAAKDIHTKMKIVPVDTLEDALNYLSKMK